MSNGKWVLIRAKDDVDANFPTKYIWQACPFGQAYELRVSGPEFWEIRPERYDSREDALAAIDFVNDNPYTGKVTPYPEQKPKLTFPILNNNGTRAVDLILANRLCRDKIKDAIAELKTATPSENDYIANDSLKAIIEHVNRIQRLTDILKELEDLGDNIRKQAAENKC